MAGAALRGAARSAGTPRAAASRGARAGAGPAADEGDVRGADALPPLGVEVDAVAHTIALLDLVDDIAALRPALGNRRPHEPGVPAECGGEDVCRDVQPAEELLEGRRDGAAGSGAPRREGEEADDIGVGEVAELGAGGREVVALHRDPRAAAAGGAGCR